MRKLVFITIIVLGITSCKTKKMEPIVSNNIVSIDKRPRNITVISKSDTTNKSVYKINYNADSLLVKIFVNLKNYANQSQTIEVQDNFLYSDKKIVNFSKNYFSGSDDLNSTYSYTYEGNKIKSILYDNEYNNQKVTNYYMNNLLSYILIENNDKSIDSIAIKYQINNEIFCKTYLYCDIKNKINKLNDSTIYNYADNKLEIQRFNSDNSKQIFKFKYLNKKIEIPNKLDQFLLMKTHPACNKYIINIHELIIGDYVPLNYCISYQNTNTNKNGFQISPTWSYSYKFDNLNRLIEISESDSKTVLLY